MSFKTSYKVQTQDECIIIQNNILALKAELKKLAPSKVILIYDKKLTRYAKKLPLQISDSIGLDIQESSKSLAMFAFLTQSLFEAGVDKKSVVIALGGGVVGDLVGFVCSVYMRGVSWISMPTTVLAQIDSGVGGKTGVNTPFSKNVLGTVYQPRICYLHTDLLKNLPAREYQSGLGEILKYSVLNPNLKVDVQKYKLQDWKYISSLVLKCIKYKMSLVVQDPKDVSGVRQKLNLGHTFAHALEKATHYKKYRHGEAVLLGLIFALIVSKNKKLMNPKVYYTLLKSMSLRGLPEVTQVDPKKLYQIALKDKKSEYGKLKMILIVKPGEVRNPVIVSESEFVSAYKEFMDFYKDIRHNKL